MGAGWGLMCAGVGKQGAYAAGLGRHTRTILKVGSYTRWVHWMDYTCTTPRQDMTNTGGVANG